MKEYSLSGMLVGCALLGDVHGEIRIWAANLESRSQNSAIPVAAAVYPAEIHPINELGTVWFAVELGMSAT